MSLGAYLPSFMKIGTGFKAMLKFFSAIWMDVMLV
jgi:hypothetical protein